MPVYSFKCPKCTLKFEKALKHDHSGDVQCPSCSGVSNKLPPKNVAGRIGEVTSLNKEVDLKVGADADKRWEEYEERKSQKEKIRKETGSEWISRDLDGGYSPLTVVKDDKIVTGKEAVQLRNEMWNTTKDKEIEKTGDDPRNVADLKP
jgi:putative FmdB family regulatory protein